MSLYHRYNYIFYMFVSKCKEIRPDSDGPYWQFFVPVLKSATSF